MRHLLNDLAFHAFAERELQARQIPVGASPGETFLAHLQATDPAAVQRLAAVAPPAAPGPSIEQRITAAIDRAFQSYPGLSSPPPAAQRSAPARRAPRPTPIQEQLSGELAKLFSPEKIKATVEKIPKAQRDAAIKQLLSSAGPKREVQALVSSGMPIPNGLSAEETVLGYYLTGQEFSPEDLRMVATSTGRNPLALAAQIRRVATATDVQALVGKIGDHEAEVETTRFGKPIPPSEDKRDPDGWEAHIDKSWDEHQSAKEREALPTRSVWTERGDRDRFGYDLAIRRKSGEGLAGMEVSGDLAADIRNEVQAQSGGIITTEQAVQALYDDISPPSEEAG